MKKQNQIDEKGTIFVLYIKKRREMIAIKVMHTMMMCIWFNWPCMCQALLWFKFTHSHIVCRCVAFMESICISVSQQNPQHFIFHSHFVLIYSLCFAHCSHTKRLIFILCFHRLFFLSKFHGLVTNYFKIKIHIHLNLFTDSHSLSFFHLLFNLSTQCCSMCV